MSKKAPGLRPGAFLLCKDVAVCTRHQAAQSVGLVSNLDEARICCNLIASNSMNKGAVIAQGKPIKSKAWENVG
jgi:hypothetical protein